MEFTCLEADCSSAPLMCYICKDYGRHKGHNHNLLELEAEKMRVTMANACTQLKKFMEEVSETSRRLGNKMYIMILNYLYVLEFKDKFSIYSLL